MDATLPRYLNDHLAGSAGAVRLIPKIAEQFEEPAAREFFEKLVLQVEADRDLLKDLIRDLGEEPSEILDTAGKVLGGIGGLKFHWEGIGEGHLGLFEALETLALGVQGKCLLWEVLGRIQGDLPEWAGRDFAKLGDEAAAQRDGVEKWRLEVAHGTFLET